MAEEPLILALPEGDTSFDYEEHLTVPILMHIEDWYGDLAKYFIFQDALNSGGANALACAVWAVRKANGTPSNIEPTRNSEIAKLPVGRTLIAPNRRRNIRIRPWTATVDGVDLTLDIDAITIAQFRQFAKDYPGRGYDVFNIFVADIWVGAPAAIFCAIHAARAQAGITPNPRPRDTDPNSFNLFRILNDNIAAAAAEDDEPEEDEDDVPPVEGSDPKSISETSSPSTLSTSDGSGTEVPENSGISGSPQSEPSATSEPQT